MAGLTLVSVDRPELPPLPISARLRTQLAYFATVAGTPGLPTLGEDEYWVTEAEASRILDEGVLYLVSPLDTANMTEVELSEEQESLLQWLCKNRVQHVRVSGQG
ncbi:MAG TPA: hypothetical protein VGZ22_11405 [Isosphaeraceae bacterium]|jgi:hypothetical protein|nr:hypothetical protein [Isosphaeraceae bacterium]